MRRALPLATLVLALAAPLASPLASATTVTTHSCALGASAIVSTGSCSVSEYANQGVRVTIVVYDTTRGNVHVDMRDENATVDNIEWECVLTGAAHSCMRVVDTGGPNAGTWTVKGIYAGVDSLGAPATMTVDFLTN